MLPVMSFENVLGTVWAQGGEEDRVPAALLHTICRLLGLVTRRGPHRAPCLAWLGEVALEGRACSCSLPNGPGSWLEWLG